jgi:hypothetical protein
VDGQGEGDGLEASRDSIGEVFEAIKHEGRAGAAYVAGVDEAVAVVVSIHVEDAHDRARTFYYTSIAFVATEAVVVHGDYDFGSVGALEAYLFHGLYHWWRAS